LRREAEEDMARKTVKPVFVNKQSERLLQQAVDSGREVKGIDAGSKTPRTLASRENSRRFDGDHSIGNTPRSSRSRSRPHSPPTAPKSSTPRSSVRDSMTRTMPARQENRSSTPRSPGSPVSPPPLASTTPRGRHSLPGGASRGGRRTDVSQEDDQICAANPNSIGESGSDIKWLARMGKTGSSARPDSAGATSRSDAHSPSRNAGGFNPLAEMDKMRLEFQKLIKEKEVPTPHMLYACLQRAVLNRCRILQNTTRVVVRTYEQLHSRVSRGSAALTIRMMWCFGGFVLSSYHDKA